ncbi:DUF418 domain-containing protein [Streptomyces acidicola]|uniref:DUF418 domain-containing protein n=1 Tax=Streptomyces acidicola TaxID=2596892 RepID=UPI0037F4BEA8
MQKASTIKRVQSLDVLRGIAIIGTLLTNIWSFSQNSWGTDDPFNPWPGLFKEGWQLEIADAAGMISNGKFLALLSILFGVGMAIQFESAMRHGRRWPWRYEWRSLLLLADGFVHFALVVDFDILMGYALVAMVVAPLLFLRTRWLVLAAVLIGALHLFLQYFQARAYLSDSQLSRASAPAREAVPADEAAWTVPTTYSGEVAERLNNFWNLRYEVFQVAPPLSAFLFITGVLLWRAGLFKADERAGRIATWLAVGGLGVGVPLTLWTSIDVPGAEVVGSLSRYVIAPVVAFGYLGLTLILLRRGGGQGFLTRQLGAVGRTALSCYMLQNIIAMVAFNAWGLRLGPLDSVGTILAWAVISGILMLAASLWLRRFTQGPFELVWRAAVQAPFRRRDRERAAEAAARQEHKNEPEPEQRHHNNNAPTGAP